MDKQTEEYCWDLAHFPVRNFYTLLSTLTKPALEPCGAPSSTQVEAHLSYSVIPVTQHCLRLNPAQTATVLLPAIDRTPVHPLTITRE